MSNEIFHSLSIAGLVAPAATDLFADVPASDPGYVGLATDDGAGDVLSALHAEFQRAIAEPTRSTSPVRWPVQPARPTRQRRPGPVGERQSAQPSAHTQLLDLMQPRENIDRFIARFMADLDPAEPPTLLLETRADEVLQLFSPPGSAARRQALPLTTRRDHHELSPDSALDMFATSVAAASRQETAS